jgi:hypothetical protein
MSGSTRSPIPSTSNRNTSTNTTLPTLPCPSWELQLWPQTSSCYQPQGYVGPFFTDFKVLGSVTFHPVLPLKPHFLSLFSPLLWSTTERSELHSCDTKHFANTISFHHLRTLERRHYCHHGRWERRGPVIYLRPHSQNDLSRPGPTSQCDLASHKLSGSASQLFPHLCILFIL